MSARPPILATSTRGSTITPNTSLTVPFPRGAVSAGESERLNRASLASAALEPAGIVQGDHWLPPVAGLDPAGLLERGPLAQAERLTAPTGTVGRPSSDHRCPLSERIARTNT